MKPVSKCSSTPLFFEKEGMRHTTGISEFLTPSGIPDTRSIPVTYFP